MNKKIKNEKYNSSEDSEGEDISFEEDQEPKSKYNSKRIYYEIKDKFSRYCLNVKRKSDKFNLNCRNKYFLPKKVINLSG